MPGPAALAAPTPKRRGSGNSKRLNDRDRLHRGRVFILQVEGIGKRFGRRRVLRDVRFQLSRGDFALLTGPNGSGKTTLLRILATVLRPSEGRIRWDGPQDPSPEGVRRSIGFVAHQPLVYDELTAFENLRFVAQAHGVAEPGAAAERWLEAFGLHARAHERVSGFSRGMRQRLTLARAFLVEPKLLLLDEPGTALDGQAAELLQEHLDAFEASRGAVVLATHEPQPYQSLATRHLQILDGRLVEGGGSL